MIYDDYYAEYAKIVEKQLKDSPNNMSVKPGIWVAMRFLQDRQVEPWERDKMQDLLLELEQQKEYDLINAISNTLLFVLGGMSK